MARELAGIGADVLVVDRYEIGERQTSACGIPTGWLQALNLEEALQQTFGELVVHTPHATVRYALPWTFSTFDYRTLCGLLAEQGQPFDRYEIALELHTLEIGRQRYECIATMIDAGPTPGLIRQAKQLNPTFNRERKPRMEILVNQVQRGS